MSDAGRIDEGAIVLGHLTVGAVDRGVVEVGLDDAFGDATEELEHTDVRGDKARLILLEGRFNILQTAV